MGFFFPPLTLFQWFCLFFYFLYLNTYLSLMTILSLKLLSVLGFYCLKMYILWFFFRLSLTKIQCFYFNVLLAFYSAFIILLQFSLFSFFSYIFVYFMTWFKITGTSGSERKTLPPSGRNWKASPPGSSPCSCPPLPLSYGSPSPFKETWETFL